MIREAAAMPISRFCDLLGIPRRSYFRRLALLRSDDSAVHRRRVSCVQLCAPIVSAYVASRPGYGHRRIHALMLQDGHVTSPATVLRAMRLMRGPRFAADDRTSESEHWHNG